MGERAPDGRRLPPRTPGWRRRSERIAVDVRGAAPRRACNLDRARHRGDGRPCDLRGRKTAPVGALVDRGHVVVAADAVPEPRAPGTPLSGGLGQTLGGGGSAIGT